MDYVIVSSFLFACFVILTALIISNEMVKDWDFVAFQLMNKSHGQLLDKIMFVFSAYGREVVWTGITAFLLIFGKNPERRIGVLLIVVFLILIPVGIILKDEIHRLRPVPSFDRLLLKTDHEDPSFPSGHALITSAGACILLTEFSTGRKKIFALIIAWETGLVGVSLVFVGAHFPLDVVGGILLGVATSFAIIGSKKYLEPLLIFVERIGKKY